MRVLLLTEAPNAGVGRHVIDLALGMSARGVQVHVAYSPRRTDATFGEFVAEAPQRGIGVSSLPMRRSPHVSDARAVVDIGRMVTRLGPFDIIHAHSSKAGGLVRLTPQVPARSIIYTPNAMLTMNPSLPRGGRTLAGLAERALQYRAARIIAVSEHERVHFEEVGVDPRRIRVVPMGCPPPVAGSADDARAVMGIRDDERCIGWVGRLASQKAPDVAVAALGAMRDRRARLVVVGDGPLRAGMERTVSRLGLDDRVTFLGERAAAPLMTGFDLFLSTSRYESFGLVLVEAASCGAPLVTTPVGIAPELIEAGAGVAIGIGNPRAAASQMDALLADAASLSVMSARARIAASRLTVDAMVDGNLEVYRGALAA